MPGVSFLANASAGGVRFRSGRLPGREVVCRVEEAPQGEAPLLRALQAS